MMVELTLPAEPRAAALARQHVHELPLDEETREVVCLLVTELVTNAVRHGRMEEKKEIQVNLGVADDGLVRVDVVNDGPSFTPELRSGPVDVEGGLGLKLVDKLADRWGIVGNGSTKVWLELRQAA